MVGNNLFFFIAGREVREIYSMLHKRVLAQAKEISFDYRCDSPDVRREIRMSMRQGGVETVRYESEVLKETARATVPQPSKESSFFISVCSLCKKYRFPVGSNQWKEIELILAEPDIPDHFNLTHTFCQECYDGIMEKLT